MESVFLQQVYQAIAETGETTVDALIVTLFGGSLIADSQMTQLNKALDKLRAEGKIERTFLGIKLLA